MERHSSGVLNLDWSSIDTLDVDDAERFFDHSIFAALNRHIPRRDISERKSAHVWINDRCLLAIPKKNAPVGTSNFATKAAACSAVLLGEYFSHIERMRAKLLGEKRGSKRW